MGGTESSNKTMFHGKIFSEQAKHNQSSETCRCPRVDLRLRNYQEVFTIPLRQILVAKSVRSLSSISLLNHRISKARNRQSVLTF